MNVAVQNEEARQAESTEARDRIRVLLIEDNPGDARLIRVMLLDAGPALFQIESVDRLSRALERLAMGDISIVLADLSLPDSHGLETFARLHARYPHVPIIVLSGLNDTDVAVSSVHEGAQDYLVKGQVNGELLARAIRYAIERKRMTEQLHRYARELREKNLQLEADFNMAREIQQIFLPEHHPTFPPSVPPEESALKFSHRYLPAAAVGGDFYDIFAITETTAGVFICDVMGHGMRAALITAIMRGLIEELMPMAADPGRFLTEINRSLRAILRQTREPFLATAFYAMVDAAGKELRFSCGGHPSPLRLQPDLMRVDFLKDYGAEHGPALGLFEKSIYPTCQVPIKSGDSILLYTDGIYEATNADGDEFGLDRLVQAVRRRVRSSPDQILDDLLVEAKEFAGGKEFEDDVCLVAVEMSRLVPVSPRRIEVAAI